MENLLKNWRTTAFGTIGTAAITTALLARDATLPAEDRVGVSLVLAQKPWLLQLFNPYRRSREA